LTVTISYPPVNCVRRACRIANWHNDRCDAHIKQLLRPRLQPRNPRRTRLPSRIERTACPQQLHSARWDVLWEDRNCNTDTVYSDHEVLRTCH
jgi:hypothetical protein